MKRKGQSAMEYLMTYGWAILIVVIVAIALTALGVFTPSQTRTEARFTALGVSPSHAFTAATDILHIQIPNNVGDNIIVHSINVNETAGTRYCTAYTTPTTVNAGSVNEFAITCTAFALTQGDTYSLKVTVNYEKGGYNYTDFGTVAGTAAQ
jgi:hypothetical protein